LGGRFDPPDTISCITAILIDISGETCDCKELSSVLFIWPRVFTAV